MDFEILQMAFPLIVTLALAIAIPFAFMTISALLGPKNPDPIKLSPYECGIQNSSVTGDARARFNVKFYLVAMCFLVFDVEVAFLFPWAIWFKGQAVGGFLTMATFLGVLAFGWFYLVKRGALEWE